MASLLAGVFLSRALGAHVAGQIAHRLEQEATLVRDLAFSEPNLASRADELADRWGRDLGVRITVVAEDGRVLGDTDLDGEDLARIENHAGRPEIREALRSGHGMATRHSATLSEDMLYVARRLDGSNSARYVIRLAIPMIEVRQAQEEMRLPMVAAGGVSILAAAVLGWMVARRTARRLEKISAAASNIASGEIGSRAPARGDDEISRLARSMNRMADQLAERLSILDRERTQLRTVLEGMIEGVFLTDSRGTILLANQAFERIFDSAGPAAGHRPLEVVRSPALQEAVQAALESREPILRELVLPGGSEKAIRASLAAFYDHDQPAGVVAVFHDVTELKRLEKLRREFVANVSHELRTPLTAIRGYAETLRDGALSDPEKAAEFVAVIHRNTRRLQALIEELLDLSSVEQGKARLQLSDVPVREVVAGVEAVIRPAAEAKGQRFKVNLGDPLPSPRADRDRLSQVLINLLDNAVKFTPAGGEVVLAAAGGPDRLVFIIRDTGIGIPPDELPRIFERFYRVDRSRDRREGGTGLGLAIAKHLVLAMGGSIDVESVPEKGTTFRLGFPVH